MSANVWFEEVNIGLLNELKDTLRIKNDKGVLVPLDDKAFVVRKPEEDFKFEVFPCVSIYNLSYKHDNARYNSSPVVVNQDFEKGLITLEESAVSFNLEYQIDFWAKYQEDMDYMTRAWLTKHFRQFNLKVTDDGGTERFCNCLTQGSVVKSDLLSGGERLYHSIIKLVIWVELDNETRYNMPMITQRNFGFNDTSET